MNKQEKLFSYLNSAAEELAQARDTQSALEKISRLIVPKFATWFTIDLLHGGKLESLLIAHKDPDKMKWARHYRLTYPTTLAGDRTRATVVHRQVHPCGKDSCQSCP